MELTTQLYFAGNPLNPADRILQRIPIEQQPSVVRAITERSFLLPGETEKIRRIDS